MSNSAFKPTKRGPRSLATLWFGRLRKRNKISFSAWLKALTLGLFASKRVLAQATEAIDFDTNLSGVTDTICNAANFLYGPIGGSLFLAILVVGVLLWGSGRRGGITTVVSAFGFGFVLIALPGLVEFFGGDDCTLGAAA